MTAAGPREFLILGGSLPTIRIGIHFGDLFCGIIGEDMRLEFTVVGETVYVAAHLEQASKAHGVPILVPAAARRAA